MKLVSVILLLACVVQTCCGEKEVDLTKKSGSTGCDVVKASVKLLEDLKVFKDHHFLLMRLAFDTAFGKSSKTGGIWSLNKDNLAQAQKVAKTLKADMKKKLETKLGKSVASLKISDLNVPLYGAAVAFLLLQGQKGEIPLRSQQKEQLGTWTSACKNKVSKSKVDQLKHWKILDQNKGLEDSKCLMCFNPERDIVFVVDDSMSVTKNSYNDEMTFVKSFLDKFSKSLGRNATQVSLVWYSSYVSKQSTKLTSDKNVILKAMKSHKREKKSTNTHLALKYALDLLMKSPRATNKGVEKLVILLNDGLSSKPKESAKVATQLKKAKVDVMAVGWAKADQKELETLASDKKMVRRYKSSTDVVKEVDEIFYGMCTETVHRQEIEQRKKVIKEVTQNKETYETLVLNAGETRSFKYPIEKDTYSITISIDSEKMDMIVYAARDEEISNSAYNFKRCEYKAGTKNYTSCTIPVNPKLYRENPRSFYGIMFEVTKVSGKDFEHCINACTGQVRVKWTRHQKNQKSQTMGGGVPGGKTTAKPTTTTTTTTTKKPKPPAKKTTPAPKQVPGTSGGNSFTIEKITGTGKVDCPDGKPGCGKMNLNLQILFGKKGCLTKKGSPPAATKPKATVKKTKG